MRRLLAENLRTRKHVIICIDPPQADAPFSYSVEKATTGEEDSGLN
jgi:hypothetical protein